MMMVLLQYYLSSLFRILNCFYVIKKSAEFFVKSTIYIPFFTIFIQNTFKTFFPFTVSSELNEKIYLRNNLQVK